MPLTFDNQLEGHIAIFSPQNRYMMVRLEVPPFLGGQDLVAAIVPWLLPPSEICKQRLQSSQASAFSTDGLTNLGRGFQSTKDAIIERATRMLRYPGWVNEYMNESIRQYCVWPQMTSNIGGSSTRLEVTEVNYLKSILKECPLARERPTHEPLKALFIHCSALNKLHHLRDLQKRRKSLETRFILFGSSPNIPPERWGFEEVYPIGTYSFHHVCKRRSIKIR
jgi:hypothetical protein